MWEWRLGGNEMLKHVRSPRKKKRVEALKVCVLLEGRGLWNHRTGRIKGRLYN